MTRVVEGVSQLLTNGFTRYLLIDVLHGTDVVASGVACEQWDLGGDLDHDPRTTGRLRIVHPSVGGESWVPRGASGILSPFRATLQLTEVVSAGNYERRIQLGMFDVVRVPFAQDVTATVGARWVEENVAVGDFFPEAEGDVFPPSDVFPPTDDFPGGDRFPLDDLFPGYMDYRGGRLVGGRDVVVASIVDVEVASLDGRVLDASFRSPRRGSTSAWGEWRSVGLLPVVQSKADVTIPTVTYPAEDGSRMDDVHTSARALGGFAVVDSAGQWRLADGSGTPVVLNMGENGTIVELSSEVSLEGFANVIEGSYEDVNGKPIYATWTAPGLLSPQSMNREIVAYHQSDAVRTQAQANAAVRAEGLKRVTRDVDYDVTCVYHPLLELGDPVTIPREGISGVAHSVSVSDAATMRVVVRVRRSLL